MLDSGVVKRCFAVLESLELVQAPAAPGYAATPWPLTRQYLVVCERRYRAVPPWLLGLGQEVCRNVAEKCRSKVHGRRASSAGIPRSVVHAKASLGSRAGPAGCAIASW